MKILVIDSCIRENSKTRVMLNRFMNLVNKDSSNDITTICLNNNSKIKPLNDILLRQRDIDCYNRTFDDDYYYFARELSKCDILIIAAPFYDLCFPSLLKIFIEQTLIYNLTFVDDEKGVRGIIDCKKLIYFSTKGAENNDYNNIDIATPYLKGYCNMLGIKEFYSLSYSGIEYDDLEKKLDKDIYDFYEECFK